MARDQLPRLALAALATLLPVVSRSAQPATSELVNPAAVADEAPIAMPSLPSPRPTAECASYWREAESIERGHHVPLHGEVTQAAGPVPPDPSPLAQPAWLLPAIALENSEPSEPSGEAVFIADMVEEPSINDVIELAMANVELPPPRATALLVVARELAVDAATMGDFGDVIDQCHRALDAGPDQPTTLALANLAAWAHNRRGELLAAAGDEHAAFEDFQEAIRLNANCWPALHNRGITLARYGKQAEALADFNRVVALAPDFAVARYNRGETHSQLGKWQAAVDDYNRAIQALPDEAALLAARGCALHQLGKTREAAADFNAAIRLDDSHTEAYVGRGNLYAAEGHYEQAAADFQQALRLDPLSATAYHSVAWLLSTCPLERYRSADKAVESAHRYANIVGQENPLVLDTLAVAYAGAGNFQRAITYEQQAIVLADETMRTAYEARLALYRQGQPYRTR